MPLIRPHRVPAAHYPAAPGRPVRGVIFGIIGLVCVVVSFFGFVDAHRAAAWPVVPGTVQSGSIGTHRSGRRNRSTSYSFDVRYQYAVEGKAYEGTVFSAGSNRFWFRSSAEDAFRQFPAGKSCEVHYNPSNPGDSCLDTNAGSGNWFLLLFGLGMGAAGAWAFAPQMFVRRPWIS